MNAILCVILGLRMGLTAINGALQNHQRSLQSLGKLLHTVKVKHDRFPPKWELAVLKEEFFELGRDRKKFDEDYDPSDDSEQRICSTGSCAFSPLDSHPSIQMMPAIRSILKRFFLRIFKSTCP